MDEYRDHLTKTEDPDEVASELNQIEQYNITVVPEKDRKESDYPIPTECNFALFCKTRFQILLHFCFF
jgi:hypothetical protein